MAEFPQYLLIVSAEIEEAVEADWNKWYDEEHLPDALACPGVLSGTRYVSQGEASKIDHGGRTTGSEKIYTTIYQIEGKDTVQTPEFQAMRGWYQFSDKINARTQIIKSLRNPLNNRA